MALPVPANTEEVVISAKAAPTFQTLPFEIVNKIVCKVSTLDGHVYLSQVNQSFRRFYLEKGHSFWKGICLTAGLGRPVAHNTQTWMALAAAVVYHSFEKCATCRSPFNVLVAKDLTSVLNAPDPKVKVLKSSAFNPENGPVTARRPILRAFLAKKGVELPFEIKYPSKYDKKTTDGERKAAVSDRPMIKERFFVKSQPADLGKAGVIHTTDDSDRRLRSHITYSSLTITLLPIDSIICGNVSPAPFGDGSGTFDKDLYDPMGWMMDQFFASMPNAEEYFRLRDENYDGADGFVNQRLVKNADGLTCLDVLTAAADVPETPYNADGDPLMLHQIRLVLRRGEMFFDNAC